MATELDIANAALAAIGATAIESMDQDTPEGDIVRRLWPIARDAVLCAHRWRFAAKEATLARLATSPSGGHSYGYALPADFLQARHLVAPWLQARYAIVGPALVTDLEEVTLAYTWRVPEHLWPPPVVIYAEHLLGARICRPLTGDDERARGLLEEAEELYLPRARLTDAQQDTPRALRSGMLIAARG